MEFIDTHCHIHEISADGDPDNLVQSKWTKAGIADPRSVIDEAAAAGVTQLILVGCTLGDSKRAIELANAQPSCVVSIGIHPHEAKDHLDTSTMADFASLASANVVRAVGECGLDYFYGHSPKLDQFKALEFQIQVALDHHLPVIFHVREAFDDFWSVFDNFKGLRGVLHSYTDNRENLDKALDRGLYIGLNGIVTFMKDQQQLEMVKAVPRSSLVLETDAPFLTPVPHRGKICTPKHVVDTAKFLSTLRGESLKDLAAATTQNAKELFGLT